MFSLIFHIVVLGFVRFVHMCIRVEMAGYANGLLSHFATYEYWGRIVLMSWCVYSSCM